MITQPGRVSAEEQQLMEKLHWEIDSCKEQSAVLQAEIKEKKELMRKMEKKVEKLRGNRDCLAESGEYAIDLTLAVNGIDRNVYHGKCLIGPHIQKLLDERAKVIKEMETQFLRVRTLTMEKNPGGDIASIEEIKEEMVFFSEILQCYDICFSILRRTRTIYTLEEIETLQGAIDKLKTLWPTQRAWKKKEGSVTPKSHNLWFEVLPQVTYLGRFFHFMEDPIEKLHKLDKLTDAVYCHIRDYEFREESKRKQEATSRNVLVRQQLEQVQHNRKRKFTVETLARKEDKDEEIIAEKKERRLFL